MNESTTPAAIRLCSNLVIVVLRPGAVEKVLLTAKDAKDYTKYAKAKR